jgi:hypothetical protein
MGHTLSKDGVKPDDSKIKAVQEFQRPTTPAEVRSFIGLVNFGHFDLKMFRNCPIRIEIITGSHIFILFLPRVVTLCLHFSPRYRSW